MASEQLFESQISEQSYHLQKQAIQIQLQQTQKYCQRIRKWTPDENQLYIEFLQQYGNILATEKERREQKIFKKMSEFMNDSKTPEQCRGHHKKLIQKYQTIKRIIYELKAQNDAIQQKKRMKQQARLRRETKRKERLSKVKARKAKVPNDLQTQKLENIVSADEVSKYIISTDDPVLEIAGLKLERDLQMWDILRKVPDHDHIFIA